MKKQFLEAGKIVGTHALKGALRVEPWCDTAAFLCKFKTVYFKNGETAVKVIKSSPAKNIVIMCLEGVETVEQADLLRGKIIYINRDDAALESGANFIQDIIGLSVKDIDTGKLYGNVTDIFKTGANDVYEITGENGRKYLIPVIDDVVKETDIDKEYILIKPLAGIFDDED